MDINLIGWANRIKNVAQQTINFDEMAARDDYIHHDSLNVTPSRRASDHVNHSSKQKEATITRTGTAPRESANMTPNSSALQQEPYPVSVTTKQAASTPLLSVVQTTLASSSVATASQSKKSNGALFLDSDDEDDEDDPILKAMQPKSTQNSRKDVDPKKPVQQRLHYLEMEEEEDEERGSIHSSEFMSSLSARVGENNGAPHESSIRGWLFGRESRATAKNATERIGPLSRPRYKGTEQKPEEEYYETRASSGILADDELRALNQLKETGRSRNTVYGMFCYLIEQHRRESFILFTLIISLVVYFLSKTFSLDVDV